MKKRTELTKKRIQANMTQQDLASRANISRAYLTNIERGEYTPSLQVAKDISEALGTTIDDIFFNLEVHKTNDMKQEVS